MCVRVLMLMNANIKLLDDGNIMYIIFFFTSNVTGSTNIFFIYTWKKHTKSSLNWVLRTVFHSCHTMILCLAAGFVSQWTIIGFYWCLCCLQIKSECLRLSSGDESPSTVHSRDLQLSERAHCSYSVHCIILFCVCFWYLPWKLLLFVRKCRRYCGSPFLFTTQELMVRGGGTQQDTQLDGLWRRRRLNCVDQTFCRTWMNLKGHLIKFMI